jgi:hypothetical protein
MTTAELSKRFIQLWQNAEWDSFEDLLSEDIELKIIGVKPLITGKNTVCKVIKSSFKQSFNQNVKITNLITHSDSNYALLELDSTRQYGFLNLPFFQDWEKNARKEGALKEINYFKTGIVLEWNNTKLVKMKTFDTLAHPPDWVALHIIENVL